MRNSETEQGAAPNSLFSGLTGVVLTSFPSFVFHPQHEAVGELGSWTN
jgi:hypothetical protein